MREIGFVDVTDFDSDLINARYFAGREDRLHPPAAAHLVKATVGGPLIKTVIEEPVAGNAFSGDSIRGRGTAAGSRPLKSVRIFFAATIVGGELTREIDGTTDEARWFDLSDVADLDRVAIVDIAIEMHRAAATLEGSASARGPAPATPISS